AGAAGVKRFLGRRADDPEVKRAAGQLAHVSATGTGDVGIEAAGRVWSPPELLAATLSALRAVAEDQLGGPVGAVVSVPPVFAHSARQAIRDAAFLPGLEVVRLLGDGIAATPGLGIRRRGRNPAAARRPGAAP